MRLTFCLLWIGLTLPARADTPSGRVLPPFLQGDHRWVDSVLASLTLEEKIGQLFMVACSSNNPAQELERISELISKYHIGGIIFMKGGPVRQVQLTNALQRISRVPLLIAMDAEWGAAMRLDSLISFPRQMALAAAADTALAFAFGQEVARQLRRLGVHLNFAPVVDVNSNPNNPVIGDRSFGERPDLVAQLGLAYMRGMQQGGVLACAKHFPGHGNTDKDSHYTLPVLQVQREELLQKDLPPFQALIDAGVGSVMVAHISVPSLDDRPGLPATLSPQIVNGLLRRQMQFNGLVITDALNMKGVRVEAGPGELELRALLAGNDLLLFSEQVEAAVRQIQEAINAGVLDETDINLRVRRILQVKRWCGAHEFNPIPVEGLLADLNNATAQQLHRELVQRALILLSNPQRAIPLQRLDTLRMATLAVSDTGITAFQQMAGWYAPMQHFTISRNAPARVLSRLEAELEPYDAILVALFTQGRMGQPHFGFSEPVRRFLDSLNRQATVLLTVFGNAYALRELEDFPYVLLAMDKQPEWQRQAAQAWFGGISLSGRLPVTASEKFPFGSGFATTAVRLAYSGPESLGLPESYFLRMDTFIYEAIKKQAFPGCQLWIAKDDQVIWNKAYGNLVYDSLQPVTPNTLYDLASLTKILSTTLALMRLYEQGKLDLKDRVEDYLPEFRNTDKGRIRINDLLLHESGLVPFIPFYESWMKEQQPDSAVFSSKPGPPFTVMVTPKMFMHASYVDSIWDRIARSPLKHQGRYVYSDVGFYFLQRIIECASGQPLDQYVYHEFYRPLGLQTMSYLPLRYFSAGRIAPSAFDYQFRKQRLQGSVHDPGAALMGGVAGHSGLFAQANDVGVVMTMLMRNGRYGGIQYFRDETIQQFTRQQSSRSRRGLGFDKPELQADRPSPAASQASGRTFGHTGFTGTAAWADPEHQVVFVFLSNRTFPDERNRNIQTLNVRIRLQEMLYEALAASRP
ncbi:MAG: glycoside hydrolase family 3 N-terminal domain-containing protein [Chitinophagales bacterium]|nr:serine hydrolase [Chitinophagales bacterium]MDW8393972.1 glycoside hydrolase family 3 N-terminal domain-containing protein [Chitinophagales bacterium]